MKQEAPTEPSGPFPRTQWTTVIAPIQRGQGDEAWVALNEFCQCYRPAICHFFRRHGCDADQAEELTQDFFLKRIMHGWEDRASFVHAAERSKGRFRSFLCHVLWLFLMDHWKSRRTARGGGLIPHLPLEDLAPTDLVSDDEAFKRFGAEFDRHFVLEIVKRAANRSKHSHYLLAHFFDTMSQEKAAAHLGLSTNAFKRAYHDFRQRLARDIAAEVARLAGPDENDIRAEIAYFMSLCAQGMP